MKTASNIPIPKSARWKEGETVIYVNHVDNGVQPEEQEGRRYEADFTITTSTEIEAQAAALIRMELDPILDQQIIDNIEVDGGEAIKVAKDYKPSKEVVDKHLLEIAISMGAVKWVDKIFYKAGVVVLYDNKPFTVINDLTANKDLRPDLSPDLYKLWTI